MGEFSNKVVLVTGGTRGIGRAIAEAFLREGAKVAVTYARSDDKARELEKMVYWLLSAMLRIGMRLGGLRK